jgi:hypothetical protein
MKDISVLRCRAEDFHLKFVTPEATSRSGSTDFIHDLNKPIYLSAHRKFKKKSVPVNERTPNIKDAPIASPSEKLADCGRR